MLSLEHISVEFPTKLTFCGCCCVVTDSKLVFLVGWCHGFQFVGDAACTLLEEKPPRATESCKCSKHVFTIRRTRRSSREDKFAGKQIAGWTVMSRRRRCSFFQESLHRWPWKFLSGADRSKSTQSSRRGLRIAFSCRSQTSLLNAARNNSSRPWDRENPFQIKTGYANGWLIALIRQQIGKKRLVEDVIRHGNTGSCDEARKGWINWGGGVECLSKRVFVLKLFQTMNFCCFRTTVGWAWIIYCEQPFLTYNPFLHANYPLRFNSKALNLGLGLDGDGAESEKNFEGQTTRISWNRREQSRSGSEGWK